MTLPDDETESLSPVRLRAVLAVAGGAVLFLLAAVLDPISARPHERGPAVGPGPAAAVPAAPSQDAVSEARRLLVDGNLDVTALAVHAKTLLDAGDLVELAQVLAGDKENALLGILEMLRATHSSELLVECVGLAAGAPFESVTVLARDHVARLAEHSGVVVAQLVEWVDDPNTTDDRRLVLIECLGTSRNLGPVASLIEQLDGPTPYAARSALQRLTGHDPPADAPELPAAEAWNLFWQAHGQLSRDQLLELAREVDALRHAAEVERFRVELEAMEAEVVDAQLQAMGQDIEALIGGLSSRYAAVRSAASERLANHDNKQQAKTAVPVFLRRLGHGDAVNGNAPEADAAVRAAFVSALGVLGRGEDDVQAVLISELRSEPVAVASAAAEALRLVRNEPGVVAPLLDYLERLPDIDEESEEAVAVLKAVAENQPEGVITRLQAWLGSSRPRVRAAAVRALLASREVLVALDEFELLDLSAEEEVVRFDAAVALGNRVRTLDGEGEARARIVAELQVLLVDEVASVRAEAASSLGESRDPNALAILDERSRQEHDVSVLAKIVTALGELGFPDGVRIVGRICGVPNGGSPDESLADAGRGAIESIAADGGADVWFDMAGRLADVSALSLAAWSYQEVERRFSAAPEFADLVDQSKGRRAEVLWQMGLAADAKKLLLELQAAEASYPSMARRLDLLARTSEQLEEFDEAAGYFLELADVVPEGASRWSEVQRDAARTLRKAGRFAQARPLLLMLRDNDPDDNVLLHELALVQEGLGDWDAALETLERLLDRLPAEDEQFAQGVRADVARVQALRSAPAGTGASGEDGAPAASGQEQAGDGSGDGPAGADAGQGRRS